VGCLWLLLVETKAGQLKKKSQNPEEINSINYPEEMNSINYPDEMNSIKNPEEINSINYPEVGTPKTTPKRKTP
jgi:hypothetical protein